MDAKSRRRSFMALAGLALAGASLLIAVVLSGSGDRPADGDRSAGGEIRLLDAIRRYRAPEAVQAVAVDETHLYAIGNAVIAKYDKANGALVGRLEGSPELPLVHLNSGVVREGLLYCAHSNYPDFPETSSVEVFDTGTMQHVDSHSFGIFEGSLTWIDWHDNSWWTVFAHYSKKVNGNPHARDNRWTSLVRFDAEWRRVAGWSFPEEVLERFQPHSCSGGAWSPDGRLYCTGHDRDEIYQLALPGAGSRLELVRVIRAPFAGQGIAFDRSNPGVVYGIDRSAREIIVFDLGELGPDETGDFRASKPALGPAN